MAGPVRLLIGLLLVVAASCLLRATVTTVDSYRSGPEIRCGATIVVALGGGFEPAEPQDRRQCRNVARKRLLGWGAAGIAAGALAGCLAWNARTDRPSE